MEKAFNIADIIARYFQEGISPSEQLRLQEWLLKDPENHKLFESIRDKESFTADIREYIELDTTSLETKIFGNRQQPAIPPSISRKWMKYAAAILVLLSCATWYFVRDNQTQDNEVSVAKTEQLSDILPGGNRATLQLADGSVISLDDAKDGALAKQGSVSVIKRKSGKVEYTVDKSQGGYGNKLMMNTVSTPKGGQYNLTLPDGTKMWLNAASSVTFPAQFTGNERVVNMTGEVYFEVEKMAGKPFVVKHGTETVIVTGTKFNINAYSDEATSKTSLLEGSVNVNGTVLKPGQAYSDGKVVDTEIERDIAWKNGYFNFRNADLPAVMRQLARWYDLEVRYAGRVPEKEFQGKMGRDLKLSQVLVILERMKVNFSREGRVITIESD